MKARLNGQWHYQSIVRALKEYLLQKWHLNFLFLLISIASTAQPGVLKLTINDKQTKEAIPFATAVILSGKTQVVTGTSDFDGIIIIKPLEPGKYNVKVVYVGYQPKQINEVVISSNKTTYLAVVLENSGVQLDEVVVTEYAVPLIDPDTKSGCTITRQEYHSMACKSINTVVATQAGVYSRNSSNSVKTVTGGVPAQYGNVSGGVMATEVISSNGLPGIKAGVLTAGEINDFKKWELWKDVSKDALEQYSGLWQMNLSERYTVLVQNEQKKPLVDASVTLYSKDKEVLWRARTDNTGKAELWAKIYGDGEKASYCEVETEGLKVRQNDLKKFAQGINFLQVSKACTIYMDLDILFMVDATASMDDEINYLKAELQDIIGKIKAGNNELNLRTGSLFYRCPGNSYVTRRSPFVNDISKTIDFIKKQNSGEGGVESVEIALEEAVNEFDWRENATRLLFIVLDEPPGNDKAVIEKLHKTVSKAAEKGIRIIPLVASGGTDTYFTQKSMEYLMRAMALATNGSYAFITDHSGVGDKHSKPSTDAYDVELLNALILRIIKQYSKMESCDVVTTVAQTGADTTLVIIAHEVLTKPKHKKHKKEEISQDSLSAKDSASAITSVEAIKINTSFKFYPNPTRGKVNIETEGKIETLFLSDINGKVLERYEAVKEKLEIDISAYPVGTYFLQYMHAGKNKAGKIVLMGE